VALNFEDAPTTVQLSSSGNCGEILLSTELDREGSEALDRLSLRPNEGVVVRMTR
jgi:hypothetical protein